MDDSKHTHSNSKMKLKNSSCGQYKILWMISKPTLSARIIIDATVIDLEPQSSSKGNRLEILMNARDLLGPWRLTQNRILDGYNLYARFLRRIHRRNLKIPARDTLTAKAKPHFVAHIGATKESINTLKRLLSRLSGLRRLPRYFYMRYVWEFLYCL